MKIAGDVLAKRLLEVAAGLGDDKTVEQSSKFAFQDGRVITFNDEVTCSAESPFGEEVEGVVPSRPLLELLGKLKEGSKIIVTKKDDKLKLQIGKKERVQITMDAEIVLPLDSIEIPEEDDWRSLPDDFMEALGVVLKSASTDDNNFQLACVHFHPEYLEACDNYQLLRWGMETGVAESYLVRGKALSKLLRSGATEMAETAAWIHFRNESSTISVRRWNEEYRAKDSILECSGENVVLPDGLAEVAARAAIFSGDNPADATDMKIDLKKGLMRVVGEGADGRYEKVIDLKYDGSPLSFCISPSLLTEITRRSSEGMIDGSKMKIETKQFEYVVCLVVPDDED